MLGLEIPALSHRPEWCSQLQEEAGAPTPLTTHFLTWRLCVPAGTQAIEAAAVAVHIWDYFLFWLYFVLMIKLVCDYQTDRQQTDRCRSSAPTYVWSREPTPTSCLWSQPVCTAQAHMLFPLFSPGPPRVEPDHLPPICPQMCFLMILNPTKLTNKINHLVTFGSSSTAVLGPRYVLLSHPDV